MFGTGTNIATGAAKNAGNVGAGYGADASSVNAQLLPFLTRELNNPTGLTQQQTGAELGAAEGGTGGSTAGLTTEANLKAARDRNSGEFSGSLDEAARQKDKALATGSEGIAANNAILQQKQQQEAATSLQGLGENDTNAQLKAMGLIAPDVNAATTANAGGWFGDLTKFMGASGELAGGIGGLMKGLNA